VRINLLGAKMSHISRAHLGTSIRNIRRKMGISQTEVAQLANVSRRTIQNAEAGKASVKSSSLRAIADVLNLNVYQSDSFEDDGPAISNIASFSYLPFQMFKFVGARFQPGELSFCRNEKEFRSIIETLWQNFQIGIAKLCPIQAEAMRSAQLEFCQSNLSRFLFPPRVTVEQGSQSSCLSASQPLRNSQRDDSVILTLLVTKLSLKALT